MSLEFRPADVDAGITFIRSDLPNHPRIPASVLHRVQGPRRTTLVHQGCAVEMVEHVLAALSGLEIDNCEVWINRPEIPGCDGSSLQFVDALIRAGRSEQQSSRNVTFVSEVLHVGDDHSWVRAEPAPSQQLELHYLLDYENDVAIPNQEYSTVIKQNTFVDSISPARTFLLEEEAESLRKQGLGQRVTMQDVLVFGNDGLIANSLRFSNECARHKLLDMIGDFALLGTDIVGKFTACRSGHYLNSKMVLALMQSHANAEVRKSA